MLLDSCSDSCGWFSAIIAALAYGSFGVPIKATRHLDVHPLVLQSYKTAVLFVTSFWVLFIGVNVSFTPWGLISGLLWVLGGTGGVYAIRMAGLAIAVGTWASVMIAVNFIWGIGVFHEPVENVTSTAAAFVLLALGLIGMSRYSAPSAQKVKDAEEEEVEQNSSSNAIYTKFIMTRSENDPILASSYQRQQDDISQQQQSPLLLVTPPNEPDDAALQLTTLMGITTTKRTAGMAGAVFNGIMTGSSLIPLHYAEEVGFGGAKYMISFATGAFLANVSIWVLWWMYDYYHLVVESSSWPHPRQAWNQMPAWHVRELWFPGCLAGLLLSIAMFGSILAVTYLGQGIGNSVVQSKILVSGMWGILWYREITGTATIAKWMSSALLTVLGIVWLSRERISARVEN